MGAVDAINLTKEYANPEMLAVRAFLAVITLSYHTNRNASDLRYQLIDSIWRSGA